MFATTTNEQQISRADPALSGHNLSNYDNKIEWNLPAQKELIFLWAIQGSGQSGVYGLDLQRAINECSNGNETVSHGTLYSSLKRLRQKGWIDSYEGDALGGGAKRQYYFLTEEGAQILNAVTQFLSDLQQWKPVPQDSN